ncbi:MAG: cytochrome c oxidase subunit 3 [Oceanicoccus sp.]|jgi:cytochrome c oxidase subunit 3
MSTTELLRAAEFDAVNRGAGEWQSSEDAARRARTGLRVLMAVISSLFFLFFVAFLIRSQLSDWEHLSGPWKPLENPWQLWINTGLLVLASGSLQLARVAARHQRLQRAIEFFLLAGIFSTAFLAGQVWVWQQLVGLGYYLASNPANSFFYLLTGLHGIHLLAGLIAWIRTVFKAWRGAPVEQLAVSIDLCAMYWHYLLALWLLLLGLLTSSPETYQFLARLCGLDV